jgi:hypothetical protein
MRRAVARRFVLGLFAVLALVLAGGGGAHADNDTDAFRRTLDAKELKAFDAYRAAQVFHAAALDAYWGHVEKKRSGRKAKRARNRPITTADYVLEQPPKYDGPTLAPAIAKKWKAFQDRLDEIKPKPQPEPPANVRDFLDSARRNYRFEPELVPEAVFKERYAAEALALGLSGDQVVRVYALETGGIGTADMQAGIHPISRKGTPISSALGYAQLLAANSINELSKYGGDFVARLRQLARRTAPDSERRQRLEQKAQALELMTRKAKSIPYVWSRHVAFASTDVGRGIHAINLDGDIGPWLQVIKLKGLKETAEAAGRGRLSGAEIELMNLAGPGTGLEMMTPAALAVPTTNFFARAAYYRNTIVREKTSAELLAALDKRMQDNMKHAGAVEFRQIFDRLEQRQR